MPPKKNDHELWDDLARAQDIIHACLVEDREAIRDTVAEAINAGGIPALEQLVQVLGLMAARHIRSGFDGDKAAAVALVESFRDIAICNAIETVNGLGSEDS